MPVIWIGIGMKEIPEFNTLSLIPIVIGAILIAADAWMIAWKKPKIKEG